MRVFGLEIRAAAKAPGTEVAVIEAKADDTTTKATPPAGTQAVSSMGGGGGWGGWWGIIRESFAGAWQNNVELNTPQQILTYSAVFACVTIIASDIAKLRIKLVRENEEKQIWEEVKKNSPFLAVLRKPNHYQNRIKFIEQWIISKLIHGAAFVLKQRDGRGIVTALYVLDPTRVTPLVTPMGDVYYRLSTDHLSGLDKEVTVPASEIIHDMMVCLWHPLIGVSPITACAMSATQGNKIQNNSAVFFENMSRPSGVLTAPGAISNDTAARIKAAWEANFQGSNIGRLAVLGDSLKYEAMTIPANEAQLIEQLKWTVEDIARAFHMPFYKLGGTLPAIANAEALNLAYYSECLQPLVESAELCMDEGFALPYGTCTEFDLDGLLRMDSATRYEKYNKAIAAGWFAPNEARRLEDYPPAKGGDTPYLQEQNFSLEALGKRDAMPDPWASRKPPAPTATPALPAPKPPAGEDPTKDPAANDAVAAAVELADLFIKGLAPENAGA